MKRMQGANRPLVIAALCLMAGIGVREYIPAALSVWALSCAIGLAGAAVFRSRVSSVFLCLGLFALGAVYSSVYQISPPDHYAHIVRYYRGKLVTLEGAVVSDVSVKQTLYGQKTTFVLRVDGFLTRWGWKTKTGRILINSFLSSHPVFGERLRLTGKIHLPFEEDESGHMSYRRYLRRQGIEYLMSVGKSGKIEVLAPPPDSLRGRLIQARRTMDAVLERYLTANEAGIMRAVLLGLRSGIPEHIRQLFVVTGTAHILAISGLHIGIITFLFFVLIKTIPVPRKAQIVLTLLCVVLYGLMVGERPSVVRATIMTVALLAGFLFERETETLNTLALAAVVILLINPLSLFDVGFQLSFLSVTAIIVFFPLLQKAFQPYWTDMPKLSRKVADLFFVSLAAWLGVSGAVAYYFGVITPVSLLANIVVVPLMFAVVALGFSLILAGGFSVWLGECLALVLKAALNLMVFVTYGFHLCPWGYFFCKNVTVWNVMGYYGILVGLAVVWRFRTRN